MFRRLFRRRRDPALSPDSTRPDLVGEPDGGVTPPDRPQLSPEAEAEAARQADAAAARTAKAEAAAKPAPRPIAKLLIANRGEIAVRIARTARRMGVRTVAVHSEADAHARHVAACDEAVAIGPAPAAESYLVADRILAAAKATGADAIHPGYGFLSENPDFAEAVTQAGLIWVGPPASAIRAMGLKDAAKARMQEAGVPVVPGFHGEGQDPTFLAGEAEQIGYPVLIKARAGGGGKGMRRVDRAGDFAEALEGAQAEAQAAFGDPAVLVEKYVAAPRHIEIQLLADGHGTALHLHERDCSLQRRHQKVIEEAPAPGMTPEIRAEIGAAAVRAAKAIGYEGAGTVEFIADASDGLRADRIYFMEMNTRLQVEHPVTEAITGLDLVEWQLRVAAGEPLPFAQADVPLNGHAIEARLYAEDPTKGFLPQTGRLTHLRLPDPLLARTDAGVGEGDAVSPHYDPMIAKIVAHGPTREAARSRLLAALAETEVAGLTTNLAFLSRLLKHEGFAKGEIDTHLIERDLAALTAPEPAPAGAAALAAAAALALDRPAEPGPFGRRDGWRPWGRETRRVTVEAEGEPLTVTLETVGEHRYAATEGDAAGPALALHAAPGRLRLMVDGTERDARAVLGATPQGPRAEVFLGGRAAAFALSDPFAAALEAVAGGDAVTAPMPGLVKRLLAKPGDLVTAGQTVAVMEAMKMEHRLTAPRDGTVETAPAEEGVQIAEGAVLLTLVPEAVAAEVAETEPRTADTLPPEETPTPPEEG
ncbi:MAG: biotin carboxylase N-terminal domain-containing protein [Paracoccaceae bacterium]